MNDKIFDEIHIVPTKGIYRFIGTIELAGVWAMPERWHIFSFISKGERVKLTREDNNPHDKNAIRVDMPFANGSKIGYIPSHLAAQWAPILDSGIFYTGWINDYCASTKYISIDVYERQQLPTSNITSIHFWEGGFFSREFHIELSCRKRQIICKSEIEPHCKKVVKTTLYFSKEQWDNTVLPEMQKCNLLAWHKDYWDTRVCDGTQWGMTIRCGRNKKTHISGSNDYPEEWELWHDFIDQCLTQDDVHKTEETESVW